jgi:hypothetical protein
MRGSAGGEKGRGRKVVTTRLTSPPSAAAPQSGDTAQAAHAPFEAASDGRCDGRRVLRRSENAYAVDFSHYLNVPVPAPRPTCRTVRSRLDAPYPP